MGWLLGRRDSGAVAGGGGGGCGLNGTGVAALCGEDEGGFRSIIYVATAAGATRFIGLIMARC